MMDPTNKYTEKADCYSFGCLLWELLAGKVPWEGIHYCMILVIVQNDKFQGLPEDDSWPKKLRDLIRQCVVVSSRCLFVGRRWSVLHPLATPKTGGRVERRRFVWAFAGA